MFGEGESGCCETDSRRLAPEASPAKTTTISDAALRRAIGKLSREENGDFLSGLLDGEAGLNFALRRRLQGELKDLPRPASSGRTADEMFTGVKRAKCQAAGRKAAEAEERRIAALEKLAKSEVKVWQAVEALLVDRPLDLPRQSRRGTPATARPGDYQKTPTEFNHRLKQLRERHIGRASIMKRFDRAGLA